MLAGIDALFLHVFATSSTAVTDLLESAKQIRPQHLSFFKLPQIWEHVYNYEYYHQCKYMNIVY